MAEINIVDHAQEEEEADHGKGQKKRSHAKARWSWSFNCNIVVGSSRYWTVYLHQSIFVKFSSCETLLKECI